MNVKTVTVIGANGTMGCNISAIFASFGRAKVYMVCRDLKAAREAVMRASKSVKASSIIDNLIPKTYSDLENCVKESDIVFESVSENLDIKADVLQKISPYVKENSVIATGTSGLSLNVLSNYVSNKAAFLGLHFYNPPYNLTLCEVIPSDVTDPYLLKEIKEYLKNILLRKVVEVKDTPAFLGNRIGFYFINEAMRYAEVYQNRGGIDYIDKILGPFSGRSMPPLVTSDFVGLDVHKAIVDNVYLNATNDKFIESFKFPAFAERMVIDGHLGRKSHGGLYKSVMDNNKKTLQVFDIKSSMYRPVEKYEFPFSVKMINFLKHGKYQEAFKILVESDSIESLICLEFIQKYVIYALNAAKQYGENMHAADDIMSTGFNWIPPLALIDVFGGIASFKQHLRKNDIYEKIDLDRVLYNLPKSHYDYRPFLRAR